MKAIEKLGMTLPIGFSSKGQEFVEFELNPVKGRLRREYLNLRKRSPARETFIALRHVLAKLGPFDKPSDVFLKQLTLPDVDYIFLLVSVQQSETGHITWEVPCDEEAGGCGESNTVNVNPEEVELLEASPEITFDEAGKPIQATVFKDPVSKQEVPIVFKIPSLDDQIRLFDKLGTGNAETFGNFIFHQMSHMMIDYDRRGTGLSTSEMDDMPVQTLDALLEHNSKHNPTQLDTEVKVMCSRCSMEHTVDLPLEAWITPFAQKRASPP